MNASSGLCSWPWLLQLFKELAAGSLGWRHSQPWEIHHWCLWGQQQLVLMPNLNVLGGVGENSVMMLFYWDSSG